MPSPRPRGGARRRSWSYTRGFLPHLELPPWQRDRLHLATAEGIAALIELAGLGRCSVMPGADGWWIVLVDAGDGHLAYLRSLGEAAPLIGRAFRVHIQRHGRDTDSLPRARRGEAPSSSAEQQIREASTDVLAERAAEEAESLPRAGRGEEARR